MEDLSPQDEDFAGWTDGVVAAKNITLNKVASELRHFGIQLIDTKNAVFYGENVPVQKARTVFKQDNPNNNPHYNAGWERGLIDGRAGVIRSLRGIKTINDWDLIILDDGRPVPSSLCTKLCTQHESLSQAIPEDISSESLHEALDSEEEKRAQYALEIAELEQRASSVPIDPNPASQPDHQGQDAPAAHQRVGLLQTLGAFFMTIRNHMDRRTATFAIASAVLASGATFLSMGGTLSSSPKDSLPAIIENNAQGPQPVVPAVWAGIPQPAAATFMLVDSYINNPPIGVDPGLIAFGYMTSPAPGLNALKKTVGRVIADRGHGALLPSLVASLSSTATTDPETRLSLLILVRQYFALHGIADFTPAIQNAMAQLYTSAGSPQTAFDGYLDKVLTDLGIPH